MVGSVITLEHVTCRQGRLVAVEDVSAQFAPGLSAIAGPNGAGKTTLLRTIAGLHKLASGRISGIGSARDVALLPQSGGLDRRFPITCRELVALGAWGEIGAFGSLRPAQGKRVDAALAQMGLGGLGERLIAALSAGQFQRVLFARLIVQDAPIILLDEPFTAIDHKTTVDLLDLVLRWGAEGRTVIAVLHDHDQVRRHFPSTLMLAREAIGWGPTAEVLTAANLLKARAMSEAWDEAAPFCERGAA